jgi:hypothetical protein
MKTILIIFGGLVFLLIACGKNPFPSQEKSEGPSIPKIVVEKENVKKGQPLPPEVKIKLKKDGKESYSWELTGSDVDQILKVNEKLKKQLGGEPFR